MRSSILLSLLFTIFMGGEASANEANWSYLYAGDPITLDRSEQQLAVLSSVAGEEQLPHLRQLCAQFPELTVVKAEHRRSSTGLWVLEAELPVAEERCLEICETLAKSSGVSFATPVFQVQDRMVVPRPALLLSVDAKQPDPRGWLGTLGLEVVREFSTPHPMFVVEYSGSAASVFARSRELTERPEILWAEPDFIIECERLAVPNDPRFVDQWHLDNTGEVWGIADADIGAVEAWDITTGSPSITIAILDDGVDVTHEDLIDNLVPGHDSTDQPPPGGIPGANLPSDGHGTAVAGIAGARGDNNLGVAGVAWNCKIMPIRIFYENFEQPSWAVDGIMWAADNGADILSNSWGDPMPFASEQTAIQYAKTTGRGGLGCPVFFATGNNSSSVALYPARFPETIAIGGSSPCDSHKSGSACDNVSWGANYGPDLDMVAPATKMVTTRRMSSPGSSFNYQSLFGGTSAAAPVASGIAALLLSVDPSLTADQVQDVMQRSCEDQVGFFEVDTPGKDQRMGWGRVSAHRALLLATGSADAPRELTCSVLNQDVTLTWQLPQSFESIEISRDGFALATIAGTATQYVDTVAPGGPYEYRVFGIASGQPGLTARCTVLVGGGATELVFCSPEAGGAIDGGTALVDALIANGRPTLKIAELHARADLNQFGRVWATYGIAPDNHLMSPAESEALLRFMNDNIGGQQLYVEGGSLWEDDPRTVLLSAMHLGGSPGGELGNVDGYTFAECNFSGNDVVYNGEVGESNRVGFSLPAFWDSNLMQQNQFPSFWVTVHHIGTTREMIQSSQEFGGYSSSGAVTRNQLMAEYLGCLGVPVLSPTSPFHRGDPNGDGSLDIADPLVSLSVLFAGEANSCDDAHDANDDGNFDIGDPLFLLSYLFSQGSLPGAPGPTMCGLDPTPDSIGCVAFRACP